VLTKLYIKNFAIISELELHFNTGLIALTGETGAGKSIILGAINLLLGARADSNSLYNKDEKCIIEATFENNASAANAFLKKNDIDSHAEMIIRREIQSNGRSRAFINDCPVVLQQLEMLGEYLIDLHRQFDTLDVKDSDYQLEIIDTIGHHTKDIEAYAAQFKIWKTATNHLASLQKEQTQLRQEFDYHQFLHSELEKINLQPNEIENAEQELAILSNAEEIKAALVQSNFALQNSENPIVVELKNCINLLNAHAGKIKVLVPILDRMNSCLIELKDIAAELEAMEENIELDENRLNIVLDKYNEGTRLLKKHNLATTNELIALQTDLSEKLLKVNNATQQIVDAQEQVQIAYQQLLILAKQLTIVRTKAITTATKQVNALLPKVGMPSAVLKIELQSVPCQSNGADKVSFLFDANKTNKFLPIAKAASGGELSRLMLCIKSLLAKANQLSTLVFDEIDTGISGEVAKQVAIILQELSTNHQIVTVTHLPQIAAKAQHHLYVYKSEDTDGSIRTKVKTLSEQERIAHIAEMLSGTAPTETALQTAKELMAN
jgi:DNA repair protein RecN (Recombination protein N)